ncbi:MAG: protein BatD [Chlorobiaceae bacterium]|nr:protein BatD [Chlorobiaceae bacterium]
MHKSLMFCLLVISLLLPAASTQAKSVGKTAPRDTLFIDASIDNRTPYVGQEVLLTYNLYFRTIAPRISDTGKAEHPGLWGQEVTPERYIRSIPATVSGQEYRKAVVKKIRLVPIQAGRLTVSNYRLRCFLPQDSGLSLENSKDIEKVIIAPTTTIDAKPLPKPTPEGFSGAVGAFAVTLATDHYQLHAGEALNLSIKIDGKGNLKTFPPVTVNYPAGFRQEAPAVPTVIQEDADNTDEAVTSRITLRPEKPGTYRFTPVRLTAFNPWKARYETVSTGDITVRVLPGVTLPKQAVQDSIPVPQPEKTGWIPPAVMIAMAAGVLVLIAILYLVGSRQRKQVPASAPKEPEPSMPKPALDSAETLRKRIYEALRSIGIPNPAGMTSLQIKKALTVRSIKPESAEALLELLKMIDHAVYTPGKTSKESIEKLNRKAHAVIESLSKRRAS